VSAQPRPSAPAAKRTPSTAPATSLPPKTPSPDPDAHAVSPRWNSHFADWRSNDLLCW
jgi:hypothetical protein